MKMPPATHHQSIAPSRSFSGVSGRRADLALIRSHYRSSGFSPVRVLKTSGGTVERWEPADRAVLGAMTRVLQPAVSGSLSRNCFHLKGRGGAKGALERIRGLLRSGRYPFVARSDARGYYAHINHRIVLEQVRERCDHSPTLRLVQQYCARTLIKDGYYREVDQRGISLGCPLSPLMGALYLSPLDKALEAIPGVKYLRFMDDWIILAESRWKLRRAVRIMNEILADLELEQHPDETFIGRTSRGFDFLGVEFLPEGEERPSAVSRSRLREKLEEHFYHTARLYEHGCCQQGSSAMSLLESLKTIGRYLLHWLRWSKGIGLASSIALDTIKRSLSELCQDTSDVMIPIFLQAMKAWMKPQENNEKNNEENIITASTSSRKTYPSGHSATGSGAVCLG